MQSVIKLPLYLGLAVLVFAVIFSAVTIGNQQAVTSQRTKANALSASLILKYTPPNLVSILLTSEKEVAGVDANVKFNSDKITVLPSSLTPGPFFVTTGGNIETRSNSFIFSALAKKSPVTAGVVASFTVQPKEGLNTADADLQFNSSTTVIDKAIGQNILSQTQGVKFTVTTK